MAPLDQLKQKTVAEKIAMNIVHQIGDALYEALPHDIAHGYFVKARQATNDVAIDFAAKLVAQAIEEAWEASAQNEIDLALGWVGMIKKAFQKEQTRLKGLGIVVRNKPTWQSINDVIHLLHKRRHEPALQAEQKKV